MSIQQATANDAETISAIYAQSWKSAYKGLLPQAYLDALTDLEKLGFKDIYLWVLEGNTQARRLQNRRMRGVPRGSHPTYTA